MEGGAGEMHRPSGVPAYWFRKEFQAKWKAGPERRTAPQGCQNISFARKFNENVRRGRRDALPLMVARILDLQ